MCPVFSYVGQARPNRKMAAETVKLAILNWDEIPGDNPKFVAGNRGFVDWFMQQYPRGARTHGNAQLRVIYAACWVIKNELSRITYHSKYCPAPALTEREREYVSVMRTKLKDHEIHDEVYGSRVALNNLLKKNIITGYVNGTGALVKYWLTDCGLDVAVSYDLNGVSHHFKQVLKGKCVATEPDYEQAKVAIRRLMGEDGKTFIEGVKAIVINL